MSFLPMGLVVVLSAVFGGLASILMVVAVATDYWEFLDYNLEGLMTLGINGSVYSDANGFYKIIMVGDAAQNYTEFVYYLRTTVGGIWRTCDCISDDYRAGTEFRDAVKHAGYLDAACFNYIPDYDDMKRYMNSNGTILIRMQNSAASCSIVSLMCLFVAIITGAYGITQKQVSACMVTGVMYIVAGVFACFALILMMTKARYMGDTRGCYSLEDSVPVDICEQRHVRLGWSVPVGWLAFSFFFLAFVFWLYVARCLRLEKAKTLL